MIRTGCAGRIRLRCSPRGAPTAWDLRSSRSISCGEPGSPRGWIAVYYPDRGYVFSDPCSSVNGVDARYIPFSRRALHRPRALSLAVVAVTGVLSYETLRAGANTLRARATSP